MRRIMPKADAPSEHLHGLLKLIVTPVSGVMQAMTVSVQYVWTTIVKN
ncbi:hypothetical protein JW960_20185 [candidate division KSB1 bacterium]|nr:hypothetical protein [candidate division KSB1 bacterium]